MCAHLKHYSILVFYNNTSVGGQFGTEDKFGSSNTRLSIPARVRSLPVTLFLFFFVSTFLQMLCILC